MSAPRSPTDRAWRSLAIPLALAGSIVACSSPHDDGGAITADDQRQLNDAAAMLDANSVESNVLGDHESSPHD